MGASRSFNGTSDYAETTEVTAFNHTGGQDYCIGGWFKITDGTIGNFMANRNNTADNDGYGIFINADTGDEFTFTKFGVKDYVYTTVTPPADIWSFVCVSLDDASPFPATLYNEDGDSQVITGGSLTTRSTDTSLMFGARREAGGSPSFHIDGNLACLFNYSSQLTSDQISELTYNPEAVPSAVGMWTLWDNLDRSGNGYNLSFTGTTESSDGPPIHLFPGGM